MKNTSIVLVSFQAAGGATILALDGPSVRRLVHVPHLAPERVEAIVRVVDAALAGPTPPSVLVLAGVCEGADGRTFRIPVGTTVVRLPPFSVLARFLRTVTAEEDAALKPVPRRV